MDAILSSNWIAFFITGFGTLFLIGEVVVNMRGFFAILGIGLITAYFSINLDSSSLMLMLIIYFVGLLLIIVDGKIINDGTLATLGVVSMLTAVALAAETFYGGLYAVLGVLIGGVSAFAFMKIFKPRPLWSKITLRDRLTKEAGYSSMSEEYAALEGQTGRTLTDLRPVGTIEINGYEYSAVSNAQWIAKGSTIEVEQVDGTRILVAEIADGEN